MSVIDKGKWAEKVTGEALEERSAKELRFAWHRLPDAKAARGALSSQPSDFLVTYKGRTTFLEVKETQQISRLPKTKISQFGALLKFNLAGADVKVLVHRSVCGDWVILTADDLFNHQDVPKSFPFAGHKAYESANDALMEMFA
jgi:hypothetical protein